MGVERSSKNYVLSGKTLSTEEFESFLNERETFYRGIFDFAEKVLTVIGKEKHYEKLNSNTKVTRELKGLHGLDITYRTGQTMMGGEYVTIKKDGEVLLKLYQQLEGDLPRAETILDTKHEWENDMKKLMKNPDKIINDYKKEQRKIRERDNKEKLKIEKEKMRRIGKKWKIDDLWEKAEKMGLVENR